ncbi:putative membrane protein YedE/YeeE [Methylobacterium sp. BE186]|uniref:YeeE/YedE family protein n=1 Tax=Methylobacterium sp. BE186 TaxID=2817715 RepID=UPI0028583ABC|nr:YeeE/YedE family protein [Methylobacterium sp. BE186]MDR7039295.1 putative membrane protein YedE/YeeE [Methylobacterium sp. BE186]
MRPAAQILTALAAGLTFGLGLALSGMLDPARVRGFLDVTGAWDPSLAFVLAGAVSVSALGYAVSRRLRAPAFESRFAIPSGRRIDRPLVLGAVLFGAGWGLSGFCPGPAVAALSTGLVPVALFVAAMLAGMALHRLATRPSGLGSAPTSAPAR